MVADNLKRPFSLHALVAEARRRARRRRVLLAVIVIAIAGGVAGTVYATHQSGSRESLPAAVPVHDLWPGYLMEDVGGPPGFETADLSGVAALSRADAWIFGTVAWRWNGSTWKGVPLPSRQDDLWDMAAIAPNDVWAAGNHDSSRNTRTESSNWTTPVIVHWDGARWSDVRLPQLPGANSTGSLPFTELDSISAAGPRNIWVLGQIYRGGDPSPVLLHWNGSMWLRPSVPWGRLGGRSAGGIVANGRSGVWLVSDGSAGYWNGARWRVVPRPFGPHDGIRGFSATGWNDAWAVSSYRIGARPGASSHPVAAHWDGSAWTVTPVPDGGNAAVLDSVVPVGRNDVWATGMSGDGAHQSLVVHWDGTRWTIVPGSGLGDGSPSFAEAPDGSAWLVTGCPSGDNNVLRWNGSSWSAVPHPPDVKWSSFVPASDRTSALPSCR